MGNTLKEKVGAHKALAMELNSLYEKKNFGYGDSFAKTLEARGLNALVVVLDGKMNRLDHLVQQEGIATDGLDSLEEVLSDIANYALITITELRLKKSQQTESTAGPAPQGDEAPKKKKKNKKERQADKKIEAPATEEAPKAEDPLGLVDLTKEELFVLTGALGLETGNKKKTNKEKLITLLYDKVSKKKLAAAVKALNSPAEEATPSEESPEAGNEEA